MSAKGIVVGVLTIGLSMTISQASRAQREPGVVVKLPEPVVDGSISVERALAGRRSVRSYTNRALTVAEIGQLLWAAQGITHSEGMRTAPSAGALYPLEIYLLAGNVAELARGFYRYRPRRHDLLALDPEDVRRGLGHAAGRQDWIADAAAVIVIAADYDRTTVKYGLRGIQYVHMEVGHAAQNVYLQAAALNLGTVFVGAFDDLRIKDLLGLPIEEQPLGLMPVGRRR